MSSKKPTWCHVREIGRTTDHNNLAVKISREVELNDALTMVNWRSDGRIHLHHRVDYKDSTPMALSLEQAQTLLEALSEAIADVSAARAENEARS